MEILGTFKSVKAAAEAVDSLVRDGFPEESITSITSVPYPDGVIVRAGVRPWFRWVSAVGGVLGAFAGFALAAGTAYLYPVQTGDKPIITVFPTGIITYEITMLCAILGAIVGMFMEMKLPPWREKVYDPAIASGVIGICVLISVDQLSQVEKIMRDAGALRIAREKRPLLGDFQ